MCQENSNLGILLANATHANIHWIVIKALVNNNIIMQWQLNDSQLLILKVPYKSLYNFLSNIVLFTMSDRHKKVTFSDLF